MKSIAGQSWGVHPACLMVLYKSTGWYVIKYGGVCFSGMSDCHMRRLERIQWRAGRICFGLMRSTHVLSVKVLVGLTPIRQRLSFLNERLMERELHRIWNLLKNTFFQNLFARFASL
jgi:hypothetical protein